jgi:hypothetical protein
VTVLSLLSLGRTDEAVVRCRDARARAPQNAHLALMVESLDASVEGNHDQGIRAVELLESFPGFTDPEGFFYWAQVCVSLRDRPRAMRLLERAVEGGFYCVRGYETSPAFDALRLDPAFVALVGRAREKQASAARAFADADGPRLLGLAVS